MLSPEVEKKIKLDLLDQLKDAIENNMMDSIMPKAEAVVVDEKEPKDKMEADTSCEDDEEEPDEDSMRVKKLFSKA